MSAAEATATEGQAAVGEKTELLDTVPDTRDDDAMQHIETETGATKTVEEVAAAVEEGSDDVEGGDGEEKEQQDSWRVAREPSIYVNVGELSAQQKADLNAPACCQGGCHYCSIVGACCLITVIVPLILLLGVSPSIRGDHELAAQSAATCGVVLAAVGVLWFCCLTSFRTMLVDGVCCMPEGVEAKRGWTVLESSTDAEQKEVRRIKVIVNPNAGLKKSTSKLEECKRVWEPKGIEVVVLETTHAGHAREIARDEDLTGVDVLCAIGGDGTLHELSNGFLAREQPCDTVLGFIPGGSGNSLMAHLGTWDVTEAAERIARGEVCRMDVVEVATRGESIASLNLVGLGLVGVSGVLAENYRCLGPARYNAVAVWKILTGYNEIMKIELEDEDGSTYRVDQKISTLYFNKTQHFGKGLRAAPHAQMGNGLMEMYGIQGGAAASRGSTLAALQQLPKAAHVNHPAIIYKRPRRCTLTMSGPGVFNVDGEVLQHDGKIVLTCHEACLPVMADREALALNNVA